MDSDSESIRNVLEGNRESFKEIIKNYEGKVLRLCASMVGGSKSEDAAQEIFLKIYQSLSQFKGESRFSTWVYRIATNHCLNLIKKSKQERFLSIDVSRLEEKAPNPFDILEKKQIVTALLQKMAPQDRAILMLRELEGLSYKEISESLRISLDLVKVRLFRARSEFLKESKKFL